MSDETASLLEVFSSIQGEGLHVGRRHIFVRTVGCNLACRYCDTPASRQDPPLLWPVLSFEDEIASYPNPASVSDALESVNILLSECGPHAAVTITGGEPLLHAPFVEALASGIRDLGLPVHLETNATLTDAFAAVLPYVNVVAADVKLKSVAGAGSPTLSTHRRFLGIAAGRVELFVKLVVTAETDAAEVKAAAEMVAGLDANIPVVIQPATANGRISISSTELSRLQCTCLNVLRDVRVIPQCHRILGLR